MKRFISAALAVLVIALCGATTPALAGSKTASSKSVPLLVGPPVTDIQSPYLPALQCVAAIIPTLKIPDAMKRTAFSVGSFADSTGKVQQVSDSGTGYFSSQGGATMLQTSLGLAGVRVVDSSPVYRVLTDWSLDKLARSNVPPPVEEKLGSQTSPAKAASRFQANFLFPDVLVSGAITTFDINFSSKGGGLKVRGIGGSRHVNRINVGMDASATRMIGGPGQGGELVAQTRIQKQVIGYQNELGITGFFGPVGSSTLIEFDLGEHQFEAIQYVERVMIDRLAFDIVSDYFDITECAAHRAYGDALMQPPPQALALPQ